MSPLSTGTIPSFPINKKQCEVNCKAENGSLRYIVTYEYTLLPTNTRDTTAGNAIPCFYLFLKSYNFFGN